MAWIRAMGGGNAEKKAENLFLNDIANFTLYNPNNDVVVYQNAPIVLQNKTTGGYPYLITPNYIDLSMYTVLRFKASSTKGYVSVGLVNKDGNFTQLKQVGEWNASGSIDESFDLSAYNGEYQIRIGYSSSGIDATLSIYRCELVAPIYLYKDGNVTEQTVPLYTDGVQNVEWENTNQRLGTQYEVGGTTTFAEANIVQTALSYGPTCTVLTTKEAVDLTDCSRVWWICSVNNQTYKRYVDVTSLSGAYYLSITSADFSGSWNRQFFVSNTKENVETNRAVSGVFMDNYEQHSSNYPMYVQRVWLEKSVAKATNKDAVDWDNRGYNLSSNYTNDGGFTLEDINMTASTPTSLHSRTIITKDGIDLSGYSAIKVMYANGSVLSLDVSTIAVSAFISLFKLYDGSNHKLQIMALSKKADGGNIKASNVNCSNPIIVNRVWLEK